MTAQQFLRAITETESEDAAQIFSRVYDASIWHALPKAVSNWLESIGVPVDQFRDAVTWGRDNVAGPFRTDWDDYNGAICEALRNHIDGTRELPPEVVEWIEGL